MEQQGEEGAIAPCFQVIADRELQGVPRLEVPERRRLAFVARDFRSTHPLYRIVRHGVRLREVLKQGGEGRELTPDGAPGELAPLEVLAPREDVGPRNEAELIRRRDPDQGHEFP